MYILGITGWIERSHDASACLLKDGQLVAMVEEERFTRRRYSYDQVPHNAIAYCLAAAGITLDDVSYVAWGWNYVHQWEMRGRKWAFSQAELADIFFPKHLFKSSRVPEIVMVPHHLAHAASVFRTSPFKESAILVIDAQGEDASTTLAYGDDNTIQMLHSTPIKESLGYFYESVTEYIGFHSHDAGKTMGLAAYGTPEYPFTEIQTNDTGYTVELDGEVIFGYKGSIDEQEQVSGLWNAVLGKYAGEANQRDYHYDPIKGRFSEQVSLTQVQKNLAASAQQVLEQAIAQLARVLTQGTGSRNLCIAGGIGLNCVANGKLLTQGIVDEIFIQPTTNDAGVSLGAALQVYADLGHHSRFPLTHSYWGPEYSNDQIKQILDQLGATYEYVENIAERSAELIAQGKIIGWFQGRMEVGPRALGNRSFLADPRTIQIRDRVNKVKGRENWRPLAPSVLEEKRHQYQSHPYISPFMLLTFEIPEEYREQVAGVVHVDGSTRIQTLSNAANRRYWDLIKHFETLTGVPVVLNTSFNAAGEPIVCTPYDAVRTFYSTGIDCLALGNYLLTK